MDNPERVARLGTQDTGQRQTKTKTAIRDMLDTTMRKQRQIT